MSEQEPILLLEDVCKYFGEFKALSDVNLTVHKRPPRGELAVMTMEKYANKHLVSSR